MTAPPDIASADDHDETTRQVRGSSALLAGRMVNMVLSLGIQVLLVRTLSEADFGAFGYALAVASAVVLIISLGTLKAVPRFLAVYDEERRYGRFAGVIVFELGVVIGLGTSLFLLLVAFQGVIEGNLLDDPLVFTLTAILFFTAPQEALDSVMEAVAAVAGETRTIFLRKYLLEPSLRLIVIVALILSSASVRFLAVGYVAAGLLGSAFYLVFIIRYLRSRGLLGYFRRANREVPGREIVRFSLPLLSHDVVFVVVSAVAVIMIQAFMGTEEVAQYRAVFPIARMNSIISWTFALLYIPLASRFFVRRDMVRMRHAYWRSASWLTVLTLPFFLVTGVFSRTLTVTMLGSNYADSASVLAVLAAAYYFHASLGFNTYTLQTFGHLRFTVIVDLLSVAIFAVASFGLISAHGALGAAVATLVTFAFINLASQVGIHRMGLGFFDSRFGGVYASVLLAIGVCLVVEIVFKPPLAVAAFVSGLIAFAVIAANKAKLEVAETFPEIERIPLLGKMLT